MEKYADLHELLNASDRARSFFLTLPDYVQGAAWERAGQIQSLSSLETLAAGMTRGDD